MWPQSESDDKNLKITYALKLTKAWRKNGDTKMISRKTSANAVVPAIMDLQSNKKKRSEHLIYIQ